MNNSGKFLLPIGALISIVALIAGMSFSVAIKIGMIAMFFVAFAVIRYLAKDKGRSARAGAVIIPIAFGISGILRSNKSDSMIIMGFIIFGIILQVIGLIFVIKSGNDV